MLRTSFWFLPAAIVLVAMVLALLLVRADIGDAAERWFGSDLLFRAQVEGSRHMLAAIATSMITIAGVTFSITIVVFSLASNQYTPRILRNFMRDRGNQMVLGVFVGIYVYCLIVLRSIHGSGDEVFVPSLAIVFGLLFAVVGVGFFIFFIHHTAMSVQATHVLGEIARQTIGVIEELWPAPDEVVGRRLDEPAESEWKPLPSAMSGYVMAINHAKIGALAEKHDTIVRLHVAPGDFVVKGMPVASCVSPRQAEALAKDLDEPIAVSAVRAIEQDPAFGIRQIIDIALKALSPGVNDVHTAVEAVDHLTAIFAVAAGRQEPPRHHLRDKRLRVVSAERGFVELMAGAYRSIRNNSEGHVSMYERLLESLQTVAHFTADPLRRRMLAEECDAIREAAAAGVCLPRDSRPLQAAAERLAEEIRRND